MKVKHKDGKLIKENSRRAHRGEIKEKKPLSFENAYYI
jgi:hypothetical protein